MEVVRAREMGPERILPNPEEDALQDRPSDTAAPEEWSGEDMEEEEGGAGDEDSAGYYYQPLNQDPDGMNGPHTEPADDGTTAEQLQDVQDRIEVEACIFLVSQCGPVLVGLLTNYFHKWTSCHRYSHFCRPWVCSCPSLLLLTAMKRRILKELVLI